MKRHKDTWKDFKGHEKYEETWGNMKRHEGTWGDMKTYEKT